MSNIIPFINLNNGEKMPVIGLGTYLSKTVEAEQAVKDAIDSGYRHFDTAFFYQNEREVGNGIKAKINEGIITREDVFVVTKLWNCFHSPEHVERACRLSLENLQLDYIDLYLMHMPMGYEYNGFEIDNLLPRDSDGNMRASDVDYLDTWKEMEKCVRLGLCKCIGISNFNSEQITRLLTIAEIKPVTNQVECNPNISQTKLINFCKELDIVITAYKPFGGSNLMLDNNNQDALPLPPPALFDPKVKQIADNHQKTSAQIILRYLIDIGTIPIPKSTNLIRIQENINIFDFELTEDEKIIMDGLNTNDRKTRFLYCLNHKYYPFNIEF